MPSSKAKQNSQLRNPQVFKRSVAQKLAEDPETAPEILSELARNEDQFVRQKVTANPNTPAEILFQLGAEFPDTLLANPVLSLLFLENPNLTEQIPAETLSQLIRCEMVPEFLLEKAVKRSDLPLLLALTINPKTPVTTLQKLSRSKTYKLREAAKLHINLFREIEDWREIAHHKIKTLVIQELNQSSLYPLWIKETIPEKIVEILPHECYLRLLEKATVGARVKRSTPVLSLFTEAEYSTQSLSTEQGFLSRLKLALHPQTPPDSFVQLAMDCDPVIRRAVVCNLSIPIELLKQLAMDSDYRVRQKVAEHPKTPVILLETLAKDSDYRVRQKVAEHPKTPATLLETFVKDSATEVRRSLSRNLNTPATILLKLSGEKAQEIRQEISFHPRATTKVLSQLIGDLDWRVHAVAATRLLVIYPNCLPGILACHAKDPTVPFLSRLFALLHPQTPANALLKNLNNVNWIERYAVAQNPNTPLNTLQSLTKDGNSIVQAAAKANLTRV